MTKMRTIIIDDEPLARELIHNYLKDVTEIEIIAACEDGFTGLKAIQELKPDLVFLDIQMPRLTGFEMLEVIDHLPLIIFTTAYDQYAINAFEKNAVDYLLKPFSKERLLDSLKRAFERFSMKTYHQEEVQKVMGHLSDTNETLERIVIKNGTKVKVLPISQIMYLEAQDDYVMIYAEEGKFLKQQTMKYFEAHLDPSLFVRIHRSFLMNINYLVQIEAYEKDSYRAVLKNKQTIPVSRTGYARVKEKFRI